MNNLPKTFEEYLRSRKVTGVTLRNYRADLLHFFHWSKGYLAAQNIQVKNLEALLPYFDLHLIDDYLSSAKEDKTPASTINRRLSTLRSFSKFAVETGLIKENPTENITNLKPEFDFAQKAQFLAKEFATHLDREGVSKVTKKNYLSDVRHFLSWVSAQA